MTNKQLAEEILQKVGGKKNINSYSHCSTRLRFDLKDKNSIDKAALERTDGILQVMEVAGQTQVVIGSNVQYVYDELATLLPQGNTSSEKSDGKKKGVFGSALELISSLFTPLIDVLIGAGILKGLLSILTATNLLTDASGTYQILNAAADSLYYFLPIVIAITCSKKLKTNMFVSVTIAGALLYPNLTALYDAGTAITFLGIPVHLTAFKSSVFPIIFAIVLLSFVEKGLKKILPDSIRSRIAPFFSLLIVVPVTIVIFGPLGSMLSDTIANFYMSLYKFNPTIAGGFIGAIAQVLVIFGIHWGLFPIIFSNIEKFGFDTILAVGMWIDKLGIDGLRLDVAYMLNRNFMKVLVDFVHSKKPEFLMIGEMLHGDYTQLVNPELLDSVTNYECYKGLYSSFNTHNMHEIGYSLNRQFGPEEWTLYKGLPLYNFVDNHDVERIASQLEDKEHLPLIYAMEFAMPGVPGVYYGSEWGMEGKKEQGSDDSLRPRIHKEDLVENELTNYIAQLAKVRAGSPALKYGDYLQLAIAPDVLVFQRRTNEDRIIFAMNCGDGEFTAHFDAQAGCGIDLITGDSVDFGGGLTIQGKTAMIIRTEEVSLS